MKVRKILAAALCAVVMLSGCSLAPASDESSAQQSSIPESSIQDSSEESSLQRSDYEPKRHYIEIEVLETYKIETYEESIISSADTDIAFVNDNGEIEGRNAGKTDVTVTYDGVITDIYTFTVREKAVMYSLPEISDVPDDNNTITPTVWEVTDTGGHTVYMMGSIHVADEDAMYLPDYFEAAFANCDYLGVECDNTKVDTAAGVDILSDYLYTDGTKITDHVDKTAYDNMVKILTNYSRYSRMLDNYKPFLWVEYAELAAASSCGLQSKYGVDNIVMNMASRQRKKIIELESVEMQTSMLAAFTDELQEMLFNAYAAEGMFENVQDQTQEIYESWKAGTMTDENMVTDYAEYEDKVAAMTDPEEKAEAQRELQLYKDYNNALLVERNKGMADKISGYLESDMKVMVVVGAAHYYGDTGILHLLRERGCTITTLSTKDTERLGFVRDEAA